MMTFREMMVKEVGREGYRKLSPYMKALIRKIDRLPPSPRPRKRRPA